MRIALIRDKGMTVGLMPIDLDRVAADDDGWRTFTCPLQPFYSTPDASGPVTSVVLSADQQDDFFLRELALVNESNTISVTIRQASDPPGTQTGVIQVRPGPIALVADIESGTSDTIVEWNFDADNVGNLPPAAFGGGPVKLPEGDAAAGGVAGGAAGGAAAEAPGLPGMGGGALPAPGDPNAPPMVAAGPRIDAKGIQARFSYPNEEQNYRVEVTVRDRQGRKAPVKASILVKVRG
jgi:hypothetical protein